MMMDKLVIYSEIPEFDQLTQAVFQTAPVDMGNHIYVGVEIRYVELGEGEMLDEPEFN